MHVRHQEASLATRWRTPGGHRSPCDCSRSRSFRCSSPHFTFDSSGVERSALDAEVCLIYLFVFGVAGGGLSGFFGHVFTPDIVAESIDWPTGSPFQQEMGFVNLALGVLGFIAAVRRDGFREATVIAVTIAGWARPWCTRST